MKPLSRTALCLLCLLWIAGPGLGAQDFWFDEGEDSAAEAGISGGASGGRPGVKITGELAGELLIFPHELGGGRAAGAEWGNAAAAKLNFDAQAPNAEAILHFNISPRTIEDLTASGGLPRTPLLIDELYLRAFLGPVTLETGLRKLAWGRADSSGPLDVTNPLDYTDLTVTELMDRKIARPMIRASVPLGGTSKLEGVFIPSFQGHRYSLDQGGRWFPTAIASDRGVDMVKGIASRIGDPLLATAIGNYQVDHFEDLLPGNTRGLEYAQGGLRFTTTVGPSDIGAQYYSGYLFRPSLVIEGASAFIDLVNSNPGAIKAAYTADPDYIKNTLKPSMRYTRYHQIGVDYTQAAAGFTLRGELAANITGDLSGDDGGVYNPSLAWSAGFDRDLFGFTFFVEADESVRLLDRRVNRNPALDTEALSPLTNTALTAQISRSFFQDRLEIKFALLWNIEAGDLYLMPSLVYTMGDLQAKLSGGIFTGKAGGELSQYRNNGYIKTVLVYSF
ncbi:MAG: hypothetical protein LBQ46_12435 [Treponema sp.]|jgi:hypothetical protein|nr:hypothetical protein [Treponema sp.]